MKLLYFSLQVSLGREPIIFKDWLIRDAPISGHAPGEQHPVCVPVWKRPKTAVFPAAPQTVTRTRGENAANIGII